MIRKGDYISRSSLVKESVILDFIGLGLQIYSVMLQIQLDYVAT